MSIRNHMGIGFEVWSKQHSWFWLVVNSHHGAGAIGAAASEAEAVREAYSSIEEISVRRVVGDRAMKPASLQSQVIPLAAAGWERALINLERYLVDVRGPAAAAR